MQPEAKFRRKAMEDLKDIPTSHWLRIEQQSTRGTPDCLGTIQGLFIAIEFKASAKAKVTELQRYTLDKLEKAGARVYVAYPECWPTILKELRGLL